MFAEKLNLLMDITKTQNSTLAAAANMDASHISRLRHGYRVPPKNQNYILPMSRFFARNIKGAFEKKVLCGALHITEFPSDEESAARLINAWLTEKEAAASDAAESFIAGFASVRRPHPERISAGESENSESDGKYYYGINGKREAVVRFLTAVINSKKPQTLLLFSDEETSWMNEDISFAKKWSELLTDALRHGNRIKIIHTVNRNSAEMMEAVIKWIPVYMTGMIEPYYYPKLRDGVFQRTLFIAPETAAVISNSVGRNSSDMLNLYIDQPDAVAALVTEYERYFLLCRPLVKIYNAANAERYYEAFIDFSSNIAPSVLLSPAPSLMTMPQTVAASIAERCGCPRFYEVLEKCAAKLDTNLSVPFTETVNTARDGTDDRIPIPLADIFHIDDIYYTKEEYTLHIERILRLCREYKNYSFSTVEYPDTSVMIWGKEDVGTLLARTDTPSTVFAFSEQNITAAFWDYLIKRKKSSAK